MKLQWKLCFISLFNWSLLFLIGFVCFFVYPISITENLLSHCYFTKYVLEPLQTIQHSDNQTNNLGNNCNRIYCSSLRYFPKPFPNSVGECFRIILGRIRQTCPKHNDIGALQELMTGFCCSTRVKTMEGWNVFDSFRWAANVIIVHDQTSNTYKEYCFYMIYVFRYCMHVGNNTYDIRLDAWV